jgi:predicted ATPase
MQTTHHNLPRQLSSLIGRDKEIEQVVMMVREHPLVTLTGAGGVGKTRLALCVGEELLGAFPDGVWWVDLAPVIDPVFVSIAVGSIFHVQSAAGQRLAQTLQEFFAPKNLLLIVDNCEHVIDAVVRGSDAVKSMASTYPVSKSLPLGWSSMMLPLQRGSGSETP